MDAGAFQDLFGGRRGREDEHTLARRRPTAVARNRAQQLQADIRRGELSEPLRQLAEHPDRLVRYSLLREVLHTLASTAIDEAVAAGHEDLRALVGDTGLTRITSTVAVIEGDLVHALAAEDPIRNRLEPVQLVCTRPAWVRFQKPAARGQWKADAAHRCAVCEQALADTPGISPVEQESMSYDLLDPERHGRARDRAIADFSKRFRGDSAAEATAETVAVLARECWERALTEELGGAFAGDPDAARRLDYTDDSDIDYGRLLSASEWQQLCADYLDGLRACRAVGLEANFAGDHPFRQLVGDRRRAARERLR